MSVRKPDPRFRIAIRRADNQRLLRHGNDAYQRPPEAASRAGLGAELSMLPDWECRASRKKEHATTAGSDYLGTIDQCCSLTLG